MRKVRFGKSSRRAEYLIVGTPRLSKSRSGTPLSSIAYLVAFDLFRRVYDAHAPSGMLRHRQDILVGILEPRDLVSRGSSPNSKIILLEESEDLEMDSLLLETPYYAFDIRNLPSENGELRRLEVRDLRYPYRDSIRIQHERKSIIFHKAKS